MILINKNSYQIMNKIKLFFLCFTFLINTKNSDKIKLFSIFTLYGIIGSSYEVFDDYLINKKINKIKLKKGFLRGLFNACGIFSSIIIGAYIQSKFTKNVLNLRKFSISQDLNHLSYGGFLGSVLGLYTSNKIFDFF